MTLEQVRFQLAEPGLPQWKWNILKDKETELLKRKLTSQFRAATDRSHKFGCYRCLIKMALNFYPKLGKHVQTHYFQNGEHYELH